MPASTERNEYYWEHERLVVRSSHRSSIYVPWQSQGAEPELVVAIENRRDSKKFTEGGAATPSRIAHAILREQRLGLHPQAEDIGREIPGELLSRVAEIVESSVREVTRQYERLANEERRTGAISYELNKHRVIEYEGWELTVILQGFSPQKKEPLIGADVGIVVDLKKGDRQVSKGLWMQAKQAGELPADPLTLDRLKGQMADMLERTDEAYGMVFTPEGVSVFQGWKSRDTTSLENIITDTARCRRGDRSPEFLAETVERDYTFEFAFQDTRVVTPTQRRLFD